MNTKNVIYSTLLLGLLLFSAVSLTPLRSVAASSNLAISIDGGVLYFRGESAAFAFSTTASGALVAPDAITATLYIANGTNSLPLSPKTIATGVYEVNYSVPENAVFGFYLLVVSASYSNGAYLGTAVKGFEVSQGMQNNQNQIMNGIGALSDQLSSLETNVLSSLNALNSTIRTQLASISSAQTQILAAIGGLSTQISTMETNLLTLMSSANSTMAKQFTSLYSMVKSLQSAPSGSTATVTYTSTIGTVTTVSPQATTYTSTVGTTATVSQQVTTTSTTTSTVSNQTSLTVAALGIMIAIIASAVALLALRRKST